MAHLVSATSQREAKADWRLRIETDLDYILIAAEEQSRQAKGDLLLTIGRFRDQLHIRLRRDQASDTVADNRVVVYAEKPDHKLTLSFGEIAAILACGLFYCKQSSL